MKSRADASRRQQNRPRDDRRAPHGIVRSRLDAIPVGAANRARGLGNRGVGAALRSRTAGIGTVQRMFSTDGAKISFDSTRHPDGPDGGNELVKLDVNGRSVWSTGNVSNEQLALLREDYPASALDRMALLGRMETLKTLVPTENIDEFTAAEHGTAVRDKILGLNPIGIGTAAGASLTEGTVYREFERSGFHGQGADAERQPNVNFKTGFTSDLGAAVIRDAFRQGIAREFFASDVFLVQLLDAAKSSGRVGADPLPAFPGEIYIPQVMNEDTRRAAADILGKQLARVVTRGADVVHVRPGDRAWKPITATPLVKLVLKIVDGYNLLTEAAEGEGIALHRIELYDNEKQSRAPALRLIVW